MKVCIWHIFWDSPNCTCSQGEHLWEHKHVKYPWRQAEYMSIQIPGSEFLKPEAVTFYDKSYFIYTIEDLTVGNWCWSWGRGLLPPCMPQEKEGRGKSNTEREEQQGRSNSCIRPQSREHDRHQKLELATGEAFFPRRRGSGKHNHVDTLLNCIRLGLDFWPLHPKDNKCVLFLAMQHVAIY